MPDIAMYHPQIVHFVVALLMVGVVFRLISFTGRLKFTDHAATTLILIGTVAAVFAVTSGDQAHGPPERIPGARDAVENHEEWGERTRNLFIIVALLEIATQVLRGSARKRAATVTAVASAVVGLAGLFVLYEAAEHGGEIVYEYAGGAGTRSGDPAHVENLLVAGLYHQAAIAIREKRADEAARLIAELELRRPNDRSVQRLKARADSAGISLEHGFDNTSGAR
jgi:uncharacterized membrane protein